MTGNHEKSPRGAKPTEISQFVKRWKELSPDQKSELLKKPADFFIFVGEDWGKLAEDKKRAQLMPYTKKQTLLPEWFHLLHSPIAKNNQASFSRGVDLSLTGSPRYNKFIITK
ncbi:hypothetical protein A2363_04155 [Candidatus Gottesmanbacteria bacterium RIFOXYB1_FULL_47_11]|uniref:Uncharacterized protein n=1 Tax=Candidatus Gottesmanbacteria bacterium RIFOXYB1_FULL_47_11 TaxID=1798401 RepID=A0A1F6BFH6_9BACT|nr:MAG: hypothetical protein A2363_04155 [Candidatus Gottesmanbacteria bacterium RIFOXYB1_FULL_47_11]